MKFELERNSPNLFSLHFHSPSSSPSLIQFMKKELGNNILVNKNNSITFPSSNAYIVTTNTNRNRKGGNYREALWMMHSLSKQILFLKEERNKVLVFDWDNNDNDNDNDNCSADNLLLCIEDRGIFFYLSQEDDLKTWKEEEGFGDAFFSLGFLIVQFLHGKGKGKGNQNQNNRKKLIRGEKTRTYFHTAVMEFLKPIMGTKLYWFLLRAMDPNPANRTLLFI
jgi:hypothetical protein